ncbi:ABC transporter, putative [Bodo saltans]|uniref:ABC transporter, putative n=1 Tax=Bodo saltans TaxID=75058 RepID=A0A0S4J9X9_BODSA|nr:ABC transporter, putative [Bodo saltans]|eukprot:CUG88351.1 ABC transporter, putative [Bodo saltans]
MPGPQVNDAVVVDAQNDPRPPSSQRTSESSGVISRPLTIGGISVGSAAADNNGGATGTTVAANGRLNGSGSSGAGSTNGAEAATTGGVVPSKGTPTISSHTSAATSGDLKKPSNNYAAPIDRSTEFGDVVLRLKDIEKTYVIEGSNEPVTALRNINLTESSSTNGSFLAIKQGEFVMIRGPSGGGKTTLLNIIGTLDAPSKGSVELLGSVVNSDSKDEELAELRLKHLGFVFQTFNLIATMTAAENVELPMTLANTLSEKERRLRARQLLALVGLRNRIDHLPSELSGGEQQRVTIARSLANNPSLLLLDEPTGDLDTATTIDVMNLLVKMNRATRTTCIMVTHNPDLECYADRILYVSDGTFAREVINTEPRILSLEDYVKHLNEREQHMTTEVVRREA